MQIARYLFVLVIGVFIGMYIMFKQENDDLTAEFHQINGRTYRLEHGDDSYAVYQGVPYLRVLPKPR